MYFTIKETKNDKPIMAGKSIIKLVDFLIRKAVKKCKLKDNLEIY